MMLNGSCGAMVTGAARVPTGGSHAESGAPASLSSMAMRVTSAGKGNSAILSAAILSAIALSRNSTRAVLSFSMAMTVSPDAVDVSRAAAAPARKMPRNTSAASTELVAAIATGSRGVTPAACNPAAIRSTVVSSSAQLTRRRSSASAIAPPCPAAPRRAAWAARMSGNGMNSAAMMSSTPRG